MADDIIGRVKTITADSLGVDPSLIHDLSNFSLDLGADSLDLVELVMSFEDSFDIEISDLETDNIRTVGEASVYITNKISNMERVHE